jgi:pimeloyl-ACP methyl ester carboxylesterase
MISAALAISLGLAGAIGLATGVRVRQRALRAVRVHPPEGRLLTIGAHQVHGLVQGDGPDLVLIHGASGSLRDFSFDLIGRLSARYRVIALDRPGLGHSSPLAGRDGTSLAAQAAVLAAAARRLGATRPLLVGQSYGGAVAMAWALDHPAAGLVTIGAPSLPWPGKLALWYRANETALGRSVLTSLVAAWLPGDVARRQIAGVFDPAPAPAGYADHLGADLLLRRSQLATNVRQVNSLRAELVAQEPRYGGLTLPIEMVHGTADTIVPLAIHSAPLTRRLATAQLTVIDGAGHMPHHTHTGIVLAAIDRAAHRAGLR